jgi:hypothetical protein
MGGVIRASRLSKYLHPIVRRNDVPREGEYLNFDRKVQSLNKEIKTRA